MKPATLLILVLLLAIPARASLAAVPPASGLSLDWNDCPGGASSLPDLSFACDTESGFFTLVCSAVLDSTVANLLGSELVVDVQMASGTFPDWWRLDGSGPASCRIGGATAAADFSSSPSCADAWAGHGHAGIQGFSIGPPDHPASNQARIKIATIVPSDSAVALGPAVSYGIAQLLLFALRSTGSSPCAGCATRACLVLNSILLRRSPGLGPDVYVTMPAGPATNWATWQGSGADCSLVPVRRRTWGEIKSLYR